MTNLEQRFFERVPGLLAEIAKSLETIAENHERYRMLRRHWDAELMRRNYTKEALLRHLMTEYTPTIPWEMDDALYYAKTVYPDTTEAELKQAYDELHR